MQIALIDSTPKAKFYPLPLLKIGGWRKSRGDTCKLFLDSLPEAGQFDEIWITTSFTYDIPHALGLVREAKTRSKRVFVGGISATLLPDRFRAEGIDVHSGLLPEAESFNPDYSLLSTVPNYSIIHTSRGCVRRCGFCMVTKLEPKFSCCFEWDKNVQPEARAILFYDNNWLAKPKKDIIHDVNIMRSLIAKKVITSFDFNQGLDARLLTSEYADLLAGLPIRPVRFAFDGMQADGYFQRAVEKMARRGFRIFRNYVLYNFNDTPRDLYYRFSEHARRSAELHIACEAFPMRYQPIMLADAKRNYCGKHWTMKQRSGIMEIVAKHSAGGGIISCVGHSGMTAREEFEYWFGKNADEFSRLLSYPKLSQLILRKKGALRLERSKRTAALKSAHQLSPSAKKPRVH